MNLKALFLSLLTLFVAIFSIRTFAAEASSPRQSLSCTFSRTLTLGSRSADVIALQKFLNQNSDTRIATSGVGSLGKETNYFGPATKKALIKYQEKFASKILKPAGLTKGTGTFGPSTRAYLSKDCMVLNAKSVSGVVSVVANTTNIPASTTPIVVHLTQSEAISTEQLPTQYVNAGQIISFSLKPSTSSDSTHYALTTSLPTGAAFNTDTSVFTWTPLDSQVGKASLSFEAYSASNVLLGKQNVIINVLPRNSTDQITTTQTISNPTSTTTTTASATTTSPTNTQTVITQLMAQLKGDGATDDKAILQQLIDATPVGGTLTLPAGKNYFESVGIWLNKAIILDLNGSTITLGDAPFTANIVVRSDLSTAIPFTQTITAGTTVLNVSASTATVGSNIFIALGHHPQDSHEAHWSQFVKVVANNGSSITIDRAVPFDINKTDSKIFIVKSLAENIIIKNGVFKTTSYRPIRWGCVWTEFAKNVSVSDSVLYGPGLFVDHTYTYRANNIKVFGEWVNEFPLGGWDNPDTRINNIEWTVGTKVYSDPGFNVTPQFVSLEIDGNDFHVDNAKINSTISVVLNSIQPGSFSDIDTIQITAPQLAIAQSSLGHVASLNLQGDFSYASTNAIDNLVLNGRAFSGVSTWQQTFPVSSLNNAQKIDLPRGLYKDFQVRIHGAVSGNLYIVNNGNQADDIMRSNPTQDTWTRIQNGSDVGVGFGSGYFNNPLYLDRQLLGGLTGDPSATVEIKITYFANNPISFGFSNFFAAIGWLLSWFGL